jgi:hypothetical protein
MLPLSALAVDNCTGVVSTFVIFDDNTIGNTGITYNSRKRVLVHAKYNGHKSASLLETNLHGQHLRELDVTPLIDHIQGITYNWDDDSYFLWGTEKGAVHKPFSHAIDLLEIDTSGHLIRKSKLPTEVNYPGMLGNRRPPDWKPS